MGEAKPHNSWFSIRLCGDWGLILALSDLSSESWPRNFGQGGKCRTKRTRTTQPPIRRSELRLSSPSGVEARLLQRKMVPISSLVDMEGYLHVPAYLTTLPMY